MDKILAKPERDQANYSLSEIHPTVHAALKAAGYLSGESKMPKLGTILESREKEMRKAQIWKEEWQKDNHNTYCIVATQEIGEHQSS